MGKALLAVAHLPPKLSPIMRPFAELIKPYPPRWLLCLDPGGTTGIAKFEDGHLVFRTQEQFTPGSLYTYLVRSNRVDSFEVVCEDYRVYQQFAKQHTNSSLLTVRLLGALEAFCEREHVPLHLQMAGTAKPFATDQKLKEWGFYLPGNPHAMDAIRHGVYYLLFRKPDQPAPHQHTHRVG